MAARKELMLARHREVRAEFDRLSKLKKFKYEYIMKQLCDKFHYSLKRTEEIIAMDDNDAIYRDPNQLQLFE